MHAQDLLQPQNENMQIREGANGVFVEGVHETEVRSTEDCLRLLQMGDRNRYSSACCLWAARQHFSRTHVMPESNLACTSLPYAATSKACTEMLAKFRQADHIHCR